jgi:hypothetical protein
VAGYGENDQVVIGLGSPVTVGIPVAGGADEQSQTTTTSQIRCRVPARDGRVTVPATLLRRALTPATDKQGSLSVGVVRPEGETATFLAPGLGYGAFRFTFAQFIGVDIR